MTTRNGLGEVSDHSRSMAITAGSTLSATAGPPAISNATSTIAKRRTTTSPDESPKRIYKAADSPQGATGRREALRGILWGSVTYLPVSSTRKCGQLRDDGNNSVFCACWVRDGPDKTSRRPSSPAMSAHLAFVDARRGCGVVLVVTPRRMMEMDDEIAVVRHDRPVEGDGSDAAPIPEGTPLAEERAVRLTVIGDLDIERERALRPGVAAIVDLRHDLVAEVHSRALDSGLGRRHRESHEGRRARGLAWRLSELRNLVELANARLVVDQLEHDPDDHQERHAQAPPQRRRVRSVEQFDVVDGVVVVAADVLLSHETGGAQRRYVFRLDGREQLAHQRQRPEMAAPRLAAAGRIAPHDQGPAAVAEIAGVAGVFRDLPQAGQANAVRMHQAAEAFSIRPPTQVGGGIDRALGGLAKGVGWTERQDAGEQTAQRDGVDRQWRLPVRPPCSLIGIGEQRFAYVGEARTGVRAVFFGDAFYPKRTRSHGGALTSGSSRSPCRCRRHIISDRITAGKPAVPRSFTNDAGIPFRVIRRPYSLSAEPSAGPADVSCSRISAGMFGGKL